MENREQFKDAIRAHLIKMMAEEIAKEADFDKLKSELKSELMKVESTEIKSPREIAEEFIPYSNPITSREKAYKKELGIFIKDDFEKSLQARFKAERERNERIKNEIDESKNSLSEPISSPKTFLQTPIKHFEPSKSMKEKLRQIKEFGFDSLAPSMNLWKDSISYSGTSSVDYSTIDFADKVSTNPKEFEPIGPGVVLEKTTIKKRPKKIIQLKTVTSKKRVPKKTIKKKQTKKVTAASKPRKKK